MRVSGLFVYPVKSCRGTAVESIEVGETSMKNDRRFMVIAPDGTFLTQRQFPQMALVETAVGDGLELAAPGQSAIRIETTGAGESQDVTVWETLCRVVDQGEEAASWWTAFLETPARLVAMADGYSRPVHEMLPSQFDGRLSFADAAPLLVLSEASLDDLNRRLDTPASMDRFRPNIVVAGCDAYAEDSWERIRIGDLELQRIMPCGRCSIVTTDQTTAERGKEPLATLATYRHHPHLGAIFGTYFGHLTTGELAVGQSVEVEAADQA